MGNAVVFTDTLWGGWGNGVDHGIPVREIHWWVAHGYLHVKYSLYDFDGWEMVESHLAVGPTVDDIPQNKKHNPVIGHFPYKRTYDPPVTLDVYEIPWDDSWTGDGHSGPCRGAEGMRRCGSPGGDCLGRLPAVPREQLGPLHTLGQDAWLYPRLSAVCFWVMSGS